MNQHGIRATGVAAAVLCALLAAACGAHSDFPANGVVSVTVPGNRPFTDTGLLLSPNEVYELRHVAGTVCSQGTSRCAAPGGSTVPGAETWALHVKLGKELVLFRDGMLIDVAEPVKLEFFVPEGDQLEHSDDKLGLYEDNNGAYTITVTRHPGTPEFKLRKGALISSSSPDGYCSPKISEALARLQKLGGNTAAFSYYLVRKQDSISPDWLTPRLFCLARAVEKARDAGLGTALVVKFPAWTSDWNPRTYLEELRLSVLGLASIAEASRIDTLFLGPGIAPVIKKEGSNALLGIFNELHGRYFGRLALLVNSAEFPLVDQALLAGCCDFVAVVPDWSISSNPMPQEKELAKAWGPWKLEMRKLSDASGLRLFLVDAPAYESRSSCAQRPGESRSYSGKNDLCQANAYKGFFRAFADEGAYLAGYILKEIPIPEEKLSDYSPLGRMAEEVLLNAWKK